MKKKTKLISLFLIIFLVLTYYSINKSIGKTDSFLQKIKLSIPQNIKNKLKETLFVFKNQENLKNELSNASLKKIIQMEKVFNKPVIYKYLYKYFEPKHISELIDIRNTILENYILDEDQISFVKVNNLNDKFDSFKSKPKNKFEIYNVGYYNINHFAILEKAENKKKLLIYNQGHIPGNPYNDQYFLEIKKKFISEGYDVLSLSMTGLGYNNNPKINFPGYQKNLNPELHETYSSYYDSKFSNKKPLSLMLSGNYYLIKNIIKKNNYEEITMIGISGGGWYTTLLSSIITKINVSYSFAGTMPLLFGLFDSNIKDWEQVDSSLFNIIDYNSLYILSTLDGDGNSNRRHYQIYNDEDPCCFKNPAAKMLKEIYTNNKVKNFEIVILNNKKHSIRTDFLFKIFFQ